MSQAHYSDEDELPHLESVSNALKCEQSGHVMEAILLYEESIFKMGHMHNADPHKQPLSHKYLKKYESRAKQLREQVKSHLQSSKLLTHITIERDARGRSYQRLLGNYLNDSVKEVHVNEPHLCEQHQFKNLINFFEVLVKNCRYLKYIRLTTRPDPVLSKNQLHILQQIRADLATGNIHMNYQMDESLNDRKIVLSSGIVIKIARGLHYFEPVEDVYALGMCDYDFRKCLPTEVDIWKCRAFAKMPRESNERLAYKQQPKDSMDHGQDMAYSSD
ncbi:MIT domain-containing protein 1 [Drosophila nasuta]|uniref:MIT domain-containing protein 1 n=1 Tax=Drosophila albomicans TaxID=7291 RepID=A0A6P8XCI6_DROAB|nr:MIT domain-containing protein 1 [Drosophila albomicans]XP_060660469.1 MIT domain-containing protein 1 [Drosophila nasuta]